MIQRRCTCRSYSEEPCDFCQYGWPDPVATVLDDVDDWEPPYESDDPCGIENTSEVRWDI